VTLNQAALCSSIKVCKNCTKAAINALKPYGSFELDVDYPDELRSLADIKRIAELEKEQNEPVALYDFIPSYAALPMMQLWDWLMYNGYMKRVEEKDNVND